MSTPYVLGTSLAILVMLPTMRREDILENDCAAKYANGASKSREPIGGHISGVRGGQTGEM